MTEEQMKIRIGQDNYLINRLMTGMIAAITLIERGDPEEAKDWLLNTMEGYEGDWPSDEDSLNEWVNKAMEGIEFPLPPRGNLSPVEVPQ